MPETIYFITVVCKLGQDKYGRPDLGSRNFIGWCPSYDEAAEYVINNICDIWETIYDYAFIEPWDEGIYGMHPSQGVQWFKYNVATGKYEEIPTPECVKNFCGLTNP